MKRILILIATNLTTTIFAIIYGVLITRLLGPELKGIYALIVLLPRLYVSFFDFGIGQSLVYFFKKKTYNKDELFSNMGAFFLLLIIVVPILLYAGKPLLKLAFPLIEQNWILNLSIVAYPFLLLQGYISVFSIALDQVKNYSKIVILKEFISFLLILIMFISDYQSLGAVFIIYVGMNILSCIVLLYFIVLKNCKFEIKFISQRIISQLLQYGYKFNILSIVQFLYYQIGIILVGMLILDAAQTGFYSVATGITGLMFIASTAASIVVFIDGADAESKKAKELLNIKLVLLLMLIAGVFLILFGNLFIKLVYTSQFQDSYWPMVILVPGTVIFAIYKLYGNKLAASGKPEKLIIISVIALIVVVISNLFTLPHFGILGAAFSTSVSYVVAAIVTLIICRKEFDVKISEMLLFSRDDIRNIKSMFKSIRIKK